MLHHFPAHQVPGIVQSNARLSGQLLLENGAEVDIRSNSGATPLYLASAFGHLIVARVVAK